MTKSARRVSSSCSGLFSGLQFAISTRKSTTRTRREARKRRDHKPSILIARLISTAREKWPINVRIRISSLHSLLIFFVLENTCLINKFFILIFLLLLYSMSSMFVLDSLAEFLDVAVVAAKIAGEVIETLALAFLTNIFMPILHLNSNELHHKKFSFSCFLNIYWGWSLRSFTEDFLRPNMWSTKARLVFHPSLPLPNIFATSCYKRKLYSHPILLF